MILKFKVGPTNWFYENLYSRSFFSFLDNLYSRSFILIPLKNKHGPRESLPIQKTSHKQIKYDAHFPHKKKKIFKNFIEEDKRAMAFQGLLSV